MSQSRRIPPRSAVSAADLAPLTVAVIELDSFVDDPAPTFADLARRLVRFRVAHPEADVAGGVIDLGRIGIPE
jgi:hypothetical protein